MKFKFYADVFEGEVPFASSELVEFPIMVREMVT